MRLREDHLRNDRAWPPEFVHEASQLLRTEGNRHGFSAYFGACRRYSLRRRGDGFVSACYLRSKIQILNEYFVPFADLVHPADAGARERIDSLYVKDADDIVPIPPGEIPWWVPESHWWWRAPTRHDWTEAEINEKIHDYSLSDLYDEDETPGELSP